MDQSIYNTENKKYLTRLGSAWGGLHVDLDLVTPGSTVISAGLANDITFDVALIQQKQCCIVGIDPTRIALQTVRKYQIDTMNTNRLLGKVRKVIRKMLPWYVSKNKRFTLIGKALHHTSGLMIHLGGPARTFLSPTGEEVQTISINDVLAMYPGASLLKLDIEGAEFPVVDGISYKLRLPQLAISFHTWLNSASDQYPNEGVVPSIYTARDVLEAVKKIKGMGYKLVYEDREHPERIGQETVFVREDLAVQYHDIDLKL